MAELKFKTTVPHTDLGDDKYHQWYFPGVWGGPVIERRDKAGRRQGKRDGYFMQAWFVLACNNPDCDGRAIVPVSVLTDFADQIDPGVTQ